jgi:uroporphyrin-III C-methyltransferase
MSGDPLHGATVLLKYLKNQARTESRVTKRARDAMTTDTLPGTLMNKRLTIASGNSPTAGDCVREVMAAVRGVGYQWIGDDASEELVFRCQADIAICEASNLTYPIREELTLAALIHETPSDSKKLAVICRTDRADMRGLFFSLDDRNNYGKVWLVGAGPGSADLITMRARRVLAKTDVVYYDDLVDEGLLSFCAGDPIYVGKRKGRPSHAQDAINEMLYRSALEGKTVARLKGGDPSIFGRGGEELEYLRRRWIRVETVPGVTSASAAAGTGLFSLTQRGISKSATFLSAHGMESCDLRSPAGGTLIYYMAASRLKEISLTLLRGGLSPQTPVVLVRNAGFWNEACTSGTVGTMANIEVVPPALLIVGNVTAFARVEKKALFTGIDPDMAKIPEPVVHQPLIESFALSMSASDNRIPPSYRIVDPKPAPLDLSYFSSVVFSSPLTVDAFKEVYGGFPGHLLCYAFDDATRDALQRKEVHPWRIVPCRIRDTEKGKLRKGNC